jgi:uncharacterized membrane protein
MYSYGKWIKNLEMRNMQITDHTILILTFNHSPCAAWSEWFRYYAYTLIHKSFIAEYYDRAFVFSLTLHHEIVWR